MSHQHLGVVIGPDGNRLYGFDAELFLKMEGKRDRNWERKIMEWVQAVLGEPLPDLDDVWVSLKSGIALCKLANTISPGVIKKYSTTRLVALVERDNIDLFLQACWKLGVPTAKMFATSDLYNRKGITNVYSCLDALSSLAPRLGWKGATVKKSGGGKSAPATKAKKWDKVQGVKTVHADDLMDSAGKKKLDAKLALAEAELELKKLKASSAGAKQEVAGLRGEVSSLKQKLRDAKGGGAAGNAAVADSEQIGKLKRKLAAAQDEKEELKNQLKEAQTAASSSNKVAAAGGSKENGVDSAEYKRLKSEHREAAKQASELKRENNKLHKQVREGKSASSALKRAREEKEVAVKKAKQAEETRDREVKTLKSQLARVTEHQGSLQRKLAHAQEQAGKADNTDDDEGDDETLVEALEETINEMSVKISELMSDNAALKSNNSSAKIDVKMLNQKVRELEEEVELLQEGSDTEDEDDAQDHWVSDDDEMETVAVVVPEGRPSAVVARRSSVRPEVEEQQGGGYSHFTGGFHTMVGNDTMYQVQGLLTNVLAGIDVGLENVKLLGDLLTHDAGRRAFAFVLREVLEKVQFTNQQSAAMSALGTKFLKYGRRGKPHERVVKVDNKTGIVDWGSNSVKLSDVLDVQRGKHSSVWARYPDVDPNLCISLVLKDRTLDLAATNSVDRDNFYWVVSSVWDKYILAKRAIYCSPLVLPEENFQSIIFFLNTAVREMNLSQVGGGGDFNAIVVMMDAAEKICFKDEHNHHHFAQTIIRDHFRHLPASFWEEYFWRQQTDMLRDGDGDEMAQNDDPVKLETWITQQVMEFSPQMWEWGLNTFAVKEIMKTMHGSNALSDSVLFDLLKYVDLVNTKGNKKEREPVVARAVKVQVKKMKSKWKKEKRASVVVPEEHQRMDALGSDGSHVNALAAVNETEPIDETAAAEDDREDEAAPGRSRTPSTSSVASRTSSVSARRTSVSSPRPQRTPSVSSATSARSLGSPVQKAEQKQDTKNKSDPKKEKKEKEKERKEREKREKREKKEEEKRAKEESERKEKEQKEHEKNEKERREQEKKDQAKRDKARKKDKSKDKKPKEKVSVKDRQARKNAELLERIRAGDLPKGTDPLAKELALPEALFQEIFGMKKKEFNGLASWKKLDLRKKYDLF